jgi:hypothetical protein
MLASIKITKTLTLCNVFNQRRVVVKDRFQVRFAQAASRRGTDDAATTATAAATAGAGPSVTDGKLRLGGQEEVREHA